MPTTSNFGWTTPADTDLVKDGAAAIRTLGNGIDTSFLDLKGGTSGQVLSKASNTDLDFTWTNGGDITEVQAGTGISVASGTGPIPVITNTATTTIDAEGDLLVGDAADALQRLAIGSNGNVLTVDTSVDGKIKWAAPASGGGMTSIASGSLSTGSGTLSLTSISGSYKDLRLVVRDAYPATGNNIQIQVNAVTDYDSTYNRGDVGGMALAGTRMRLIYNAYATSNDENILIVDFYDYTDTTASKMIVAYNKYNSTGGTEVVSSITSANTTSAITTIELQCSSGNFGAAGTYVLYGVN